MKTFFSVIFLMVAMNASSARADQKEVILQPTSVFTPQGFDNNDNAHVVLSGIFGNFCHHVAPPTFTVIPEEQKILIENRATVSDNCPSDQMMMVRYTNVVYLGRLPVGNYQILIKNEAGLYKKRATLPIAQALSGSIDDSLYAPIEELFIKFKAGNKNPFLTMKGISTTGCLNIKDVVINKKTKNVLEILPLAVLKTDHCSTKPKLLSKEIELKDFPSGSVLIHVRSMNGQALNRVVTYMDRLIQ